MFTEGYIMSPPLPLLLSLCIFRTIMASIEYTPPVLPPPPPAHHPPPSAYRRTPAPLAISDSAQAMAHPSIKAPDKEMPLTTRRKRSPLNVVDKNITLCRRLASSSTEKMATSSSQAALFPVSGRVLLPPVELGGVVVDSAAMIQGGTPQHQEIGAIAIKSNKVTSNKNNPVSRTRSDVTVQTEDMFGLEDDDTLSETSADNAFAAENRVQPLDLLYATTGAQIGSESELEEGALPETREEDGNVLFLTENACDEINGEIAFLTSSATAHIAEDTHMPAAREHIAPFNSVDKYSEGQEFWGEDSDAQETLDDTSLQSLRSFRWKESEGALKADIDESSVVTFVSEGTIEDGARTILEESPINLSHNATTAQMKLVSEPKNDARFEPTKADPVILATEICDQDNESFKLNLTLPDELGIDDDGSEHQEYCNKAEHSSVLPLVACNLMAAAQTAVLIPSEALTILRLLTAGAIRAISQPTVFTHTWTFPLVKQSGSIQSLDYSAEPCSQETPDSLATEDKHCSSETDKIEQPRTERAAVMSLESEHGVIVVPRALALENKYLKASGLSRRRILHDSARRLQRKQRMLVARHVAMRKSKRGRRKRSPHVRSSGYDDSEHSPSIERNQEVRSKKVTGGAPAAICESQGKIDSPGFNNFDLHLSGTKDASKPPSQYQGEDIPQMEPGISHVTSLKMIALSSSSGDLSNTDEISEAPQSQSQENRPTAPGAYCGIPLRLTAPESSPEGASAVSKSQDQNNSISESTRLNLDYHSLTSIKHTPVSASQTQDQEGHRRVQIPGSYCATPPMVVSKPSSDIPDKSVADEEDVERNTCWGTFLSTLQAPLALCFLGCCGGGET